MYALSSQYPSNCFLDRLLFGFIDYRYYNSLPPITKAYGTLCLFTTIAKQLGLVGPVHIALIPELVIKQFQVKEIYSFYDFPFSHNCVILSSFCNLICLVFADLEAHNKLLFPRWFLYQFRNTSFDDVSIIFINICRKRLSLPSVTFSLKWLYRARYGVQLEKGPFERRTADFLWMMIFGSLTLLVSKAVLIILL